MFSLKKENKDENQDELDFRCPKCKWYFSSITKPYILPCNHNICLKCIDSLIDENRTICPLCNINFNKEERDSFQINLVFLNILLKILQSKIIYCKNCNRIFYWSQHYNICEQSAFTDTSKIYKEIKLSCEEAIKLLKLFNSQSNILFKYKKNIYDSIKKRVNEISEKFKKDTNYGFPKLFLTSKKIDFKKSKKDILAFLEICLPFNKYFNSKEINKILEQYSSNYSIQRNYEYANQKNRGLSPIQTRIVQHSPYSMQNLIDVLPTKKKSTIMISKAKKENNNNIFKSHKKSNNNIVMDKYDNLFNKMLNDNDNNFKHLSINNLNANNLINHRKNFYAPNHKGKTIIFQPKQKSKNEKNKFNIYDILNEKEPIEENNKKKIIIGLKDVKVISDKNSGNNISNNQNNYNNNNIFDDSEIDTVRLDNQPLNLLCSTELTKRIYPLNANEIRKKLFEYKVNKNINENIFNNNPKNIINNIRRDKSDILINKVKEEKDNDQSLSSMNKIFKHFNKIRDIVNEINKFNDSLSYISDYINRDIDLNIFLLNNIIYDDYNLLLSDISYNYNQYPRRYLLSYINNTKKIIIYNTILNNFKTKDFEKIFKFQENLDDSISIEFNDDDFIFITGGKEKTKYNCSNRFLILKWSTEKIEYEGTLPERKAYHSTIYFNNNLYLIGGINPDKKVSKICYFFSLKEKKWKSLPFLNKARANCSLCIYNNKDLYTFRGRDDNDVIDTIEYISLNNNRSYWKMIKPKDIGFVWNAAQNSLVLAINKGKILILGGEDKNGNLLDDTFLYETESKKVYKGIDLCMKAAFKGQGCINQGKYFCADYKNEENKYNSLTNRIHIYDIKENIWEIK